MKFKKFNFDTFKSFLILTELSKLAKFGKKIRKIRKLPAQVRFQKSSNKNGLHRAFLIDLTAEIKM